MPPPLPHSEEPRNAAPRLVVTAGPTAEDIDAVRYITNRSTGRMGLAVVEAARTRGWPTTLILGPTALPAPAPSPTLTVVPVRSAADMAAAVAATLGRADALVMAAAVADYTPTTTVRGKLKKSDGDLTMTFKRTTDILSMVRRHPARAAWIGEAVAENAPESATPLRAVLGFSLGVDMDEPEGWRKLNAKGLDGIVVNTAAAFGASTSTARLLRRDGTTRDFDAVDKATLAAALLDALSAWLTEAP